MKMMESGKTSSYFEQCHGPEEAAYVTTVASIVIALYKLGIIKFELGPVMCNAIFGSVFPEPIRFQR